MATPYVSIGADGLSGYDATHTRRIWLDPLGVRFKILDDAGISRAEMGQLAANGISPAQYGFRANDAHGNPIFDSLGLIAVMTNIALFGYGGATAAASAGYNDVTPIFTGSNSFTLARQTNVLAICMMIAFSTGAAGTYSNFALRLGNMKQSDDWGSATKISKNIPDYQNATLFYLTSLPAGTWTAALQSQVDTGQTATIGDALVAVFQLGA
jgi:hypothetical protein